MWTFGRIVRAPVCDDESRVMLRSQNGCSGRATLKAVTQSGGIACAGPACLSGTRPGQTRTSRLSDATQTGTTLCASTSTKGTSLGRRLLTYRQSQQTQAPRLSTTEMNRANSVALLMLLVIGLFLQGLHDNTWDFWDGPCSLSRSSLPFLHSRVTVSTSCAQPRHLLTCRHSSSS